MLFQSFRRGIRALFPLATPLFPVAASSSRPNYFPGDAMNQAKLTLLTAALVLLTSPPRAGPAAAAANQPTRYRGAVIDGSRVTLVYGKPYSKDPRSGEIRKVWGTLVPFGKASRSGADEATLLLTEQQLQIGETTIPAGAYTLYLVPEESGGKLAFSKNSAAGVFPSTNRRIRLASTWKKETLEPAVDQLAMAVTTQRAAALFASCGKARDT